MKKYNLSKIMKRAWELVKTAGMTISSGLKKAWEEAKGMKKGMEKGELKAKKETVISLAEMGLSAEKIAQVVKLQIQLVQEWITEGLNLAK